MMTDLALILIGLLAISQVCIVLWIRSLYRELCSGIANLGRAGLITVSSVQRMESDLERLATRTK